MASNKIYIISNNIYKTFGTIYQNGLQQHQNDSIYTGVKGRGEDKGGKKGKIILWRWEKQTFISRRDRDKTRA